MIEEWGFAPKKLGDPKMCRLIRKMYTRGVLTMEVWRDRSR